MARVVTPEQALAQGISPASLRQVAAWNLDAAGVEQRRKLRDGRDVERVARCTDQGAALPKVADQVERASARRAA